MCIICFWQVSCCDRRPCYNPTKAKRDTRISSVELSKEEVRKIAALAKLDLTDAEVELYAGQLSSVLQYFRKLQEIDTSHIPPTASVLPLKNVFRPDEPAPALPVEEVLANAPDAYENQFRVSAVLDSD
jgi:aspartyl-tRNA(Asn)/glutamyl-tRNA(Gln) amidotransferase subunit C